MQANQRERILIVLVLICVGGYLAQMVVISPLIKVWSARSAKIKDLKDKMDTGLKGEDLKTAIDKEQKNWEKWREIASSKDNTETQTELINQVNDWALASPGLTVSSLNPRWLPEEDGSVKLEVRASLIGSLRSLINFVFYLDNSPLPLKIEDMSIASREDKGQVQTLSCEVRFTRLVLTKDIKVGGAKSNSFGSR